MLGAVDGVSVVALMGMFRMFLAVFHPKIEGYAAYNYYCINNFKTCHCSPSFLSKLRAIKSGIMVEIIPISGDINEYAFGDIPGNRQYQNQLR